MNVHTFLTTHPYARKIFGRKEIIIIHKQLAGISLTQSEKNRLSRDIRPKFKFIQECAPFSQEFQLKKNAENKQIITEAVHTLLQDPLAAHIRSIQLYGSTLKNKLTPSSDIDLAVVFDHTTLSKATQFRIRVSGRIHKKIDVQVFNILPEAIKKSITTTHRVLYENPRKN